MPSPPSTMPPPSTAPAAASGTRSRGLQRVQRLGDSLIPGQPRPRAYQRAVQSSLPTLPEAPTEDEFAVNDIEFADHFDALVQQALQQAGAAP
ncbi:hypothetical protein MKX08_000922 [Trichoderma sp. CBMAI-0020]|nr:hypothetical protein MKX08_000922 [Trichoderma sp. CBMAI-0020]